MYLLSMRGVVMGASLCITILFHSFNLMARQTPTTPPPSLRIFLQALKEAYVVGEPITVTQTWENQSSKPLQIAFAIGPGTPSTKLHLRGPVVGHNCGPQAIPEWAPLAHETLEGTLTRELDLWGAGAVREGDYEAWMTYDSTMMRQDYYEPTGVRPLTVSSNHIHFRIVEPSGVDALAFKKYRVPPLPPAVLAENPGANDCIQVHYRAELAEEFPESVYAAYVLYNQAGRDFIGGYEPKTRWDPERELSAHQKARDSGSTNYYEGSMERDKKGIAAIERLRLYHPDFIYIDKALFALIRAYFRVGEPQNAVPVVKDLLDNHPDSAKAEEAEGYRRVLAAHDLWPEDKLSDSGPTAKR